MAVKRSRNRRLVLRFVQIYSTFTAVKRDINFSTRYVKGAPFFNRRYTKSVPSLSKVVYKRVGGGASVSNQIFELLIRRGCSTVFRDPGLHLATLSAR